MGRKRSAWFIALMLVLSLVAAACGGGGDDGEGTGEGTSEGVDEGERTRGGTFVHMAEEFSFTGGFDPVGEYLGEAWNVMTNLLIRNLVSYRHVSGEAGNEIVADLAEEVPEPTENGTVYEFTLKDGVTWGPPVDREIVCDDVEFAFRRIATESLVAQYANYYEGLIDGLEVGKDPGKGGIAGVECVDEKTVRFTLTEPSGDFLYRLAMPAAAPVPEEVAGCFTEAGEYGRYLVSSAGYQIEGADQQDASSCKTLKPLSGFNPTKFLKIERREGYEEEQATDEYRGNYIDAYHNIINTNTNDLEQSLETGDNDLVGTPTPQTLRKYVTDPELKEHLHINEGDRTWYITMNLNEPPFDDIHVRKAVNLVMDKDGLRRAWGGETAGEIATHIIPDGMLGNELTNEDYDPYESPNFQGDPEAAAEEMKQSKYDKNGDGKCDESPECQGVLSIGGNVPPHTEMHPVIEESLKKIGITWELREVTDAYTPITTVARRVPISARPGWGKDFPDVFTFVGVLFSGENINCVGNYNYSLVGLTAEKAKECKIPLNAEDIPSVDQDVDECVPLAGDERTQCWVELDQKLMEEVVPWVPYLHANYFSATSADVEHYEFDQFATGPAWSNISLNEGGTE